MRTKNLRIAAISFGVMTFGFLSSCTSESGFLNQMPGGSSSTFNLVQTPDVVAYSGDNYFNSSTTASSRNYIASRATSGFVMPDYVSPTNYEVLPINEDDPNYQYNKEWFARELQAKTYMINSSGNYNIKANNGSAVLYIESSPVNLKLLEANSEITIYVKEGVDLNLINSNFSFNGKVNIYVYGSLSVPTNNLTVNNGAKFYFKELKDDELNLTIGANNWPEVWVEGDIEVKKIDINNGVINANSLMFDEWNQANDSRVNIVEGITATGDMTLKCQSTMSFSCINVAGNLIIENGTTFNVDQYIHAKNITVKTGATFNMGEGSYILADNELYLENSPRFKFSGIKKSVVQAKSFKAIARENNNTAMNFGSYFENGSTPLELYFLEMYNKDNAGAGNIINNAHVYPNGVKLYTNNNFDGEKEGYGCGTVTSTDPDPDPEDPDDPDPDPDPTPGPTPNPPSGVMKYSNNVEINLSLEKHNIQYTEYQATHVSIHVRHATDVEVSIPLPLEYVCEADDFAIVAKHDYDETRIPKEEIRQFTIANDEGSVLGTVTMTIEHLDNGTNIKTDGINQNIIDYLNKKYGDGLTFEVWVYTNIEHSSWETGNVHGNLSKALLKVFLNETKVKFLDDEPDLYVNSFNSNYNFTTSQYEKFEDDYIVDIDDTNKPSFYTGVQGSFLNGSNFNILYYNKSAK